MTPIKPEQGFPVIGWRLQPPLAVQCAVGVHLRSGWVPVRAVILAAIVTCVLMVALKSMGIPILQRNYKVTGIIDGDTIEVEYRGESKLVQIAGVDAPELHKGPTQFGEPLSIEAKNFLTRKLLHENVRLEFLESNSKYDYKDRLLCWVWLGDENISYTLVATGLAKFSGAAEGRRRELLVMLQNDAQDHLRGVWSGSSLVGHPSDPGDE